MTRVLLITGARSLTDSPAAERWARALIAEALAAVDLLIVGDAPGPDRWAWEIAGNEGLRCDEYLAVPGGADGWVHAWAGIIRGRCCRRWAPPGTSTHPLARNAAMVADVAEVAKRRHLIAGVLALLDGRKPAVVQPGEKRPTRGTERTVGLARAAGLTVDPRTWTPKGAST